MDQALKERILRDIDKATEPNVMSQQDAYEFLSELQSDIESRVEALAEEMEDVEE